MSEQSSAPNTRSVDSIPVAKTPEGGYKDIFPGAILSGCPTTLIAEAPDLRGLWEAYEVSVQGTPQTDHEILGSIQRIEQSGDRIVITSGGVIHDMRCDGTEENGVNDVMAADFKTPITVKATYEDGVHILRPVGMPIEVRRWREGNDLVWDYGGFFSARLKQVGSSEDIPTVLKLNSTESQE